MGLPSYRVRKAVAGSVPCSATRIQTPTGCGWDFYVLPPAPANRCGTSNRCAFVLVRYLHGAVCRSGKSTQDRQSTEISVKSAKTRLSIPE